MPHTEQNKESHSLKTKDTQQPSKAWKSRINTEDEKEVTQLQPIPQSVPRLESQTEQQGEKMLMCMVGGNNDYANDQDGQDDFLGDIPEEVKKNAGELKRLAEHTVNQWQQKAKRMRIEMHNSVDRHIDALEKCISENAKDISLAHKRVPTLLNNLSDSIVYRNNLGDTCANIAQEMHC